MKFFFLKTMISAITIAIVSGIAGKFPKIGALILSLPTVTILALIMIWFEEKKIAPIAQVSKEMFAFVPLGLLMFIPLAFAEQWNFNFWLALGLGIILSSIALSIWLFAR